MSINEIERIVIRHVSGSKANQIEQIPFVNLTEITIGRDPSSNIAFDSPRDDIVSRRHAVIRVIRGDQISFRLSDLGSSNGTFLNGEPITEEKELLPEDTIGLGKNGLKFIFDVQPRPANMVSRTRVIDITDPASTRIIKATGITAASTAAQDAVTKGNINVEPALQKFEPPPKPGIGRETVIRMLGEERRSTSRVWISALAGFVAFAALGGGAFYWKHKHDLEEMKNEEAILASKLDQSTADVEQKAEDAERRRQAERGLTPADIVKQFGNTTAKITRAWRLYDQTTGRPIFHQTISVPVGKRENRTCPAYVNLGEKYGIVRWLTLEDDNRTNIPIGGRASGTGFAVNEQGFMLTNKHVAANWNLAFGQEDPATSDKARSCGWLYEYTGGPSAKSRKLRMPQLIDLSDDAFSDLKAWVPATGGIVFMKDLALAIGAERNVPDPKKGGNRTFFGRNDVLEVRFANSRLSANANLVRSSNDSDAALIKVDTPQRLNTVGIASDDTVRVGETVMALGYPSVAEKMVAISSTIENGQYRENTDVVPVPFVSEGIVALLSPRERTENGVTVVGSSGEVIQMSINSTGAGNSGGPVFNNEGKVIGIFTYGISSGGANTSGAIPIKYGRDLLSAQYP